MLCLATFIPGTSISPRIELPANFDNRVIELGKNAPDLRLLCLFQWELGIESFPLQSVGRWRHSETHRSVYTLSLHLGFLQRRRDTFSLSSLLVEQ